MIDGLLLRLLAGEIQAIQGDPDQASREERSAQLEAELIEADSPATLRLELTETEFRLYRAYMRQVSQGLWTVVPPEVHAWMLERLASTSAVLSERWRGAMLPHHWQDSEDPDFISARTIAAVFWHVEDPPVRQLCVAALAAFDDVQGSPGWDFGRPDRLAVSTLWRDDAVLDRSGEAATLLIGDIAEILLDMWTVQDARAGLGRALQDLLAFSRDRRDLSEIVPFSVRRRADQLGGEAGTALRSIVAGF